MVTRLYSDTTSLHELCLKSQTREAVHDLQLVDDFLQVVGLNLTGHDLHHLLADLANLLVLGVGGLSDLVGALLCETHAEQTQKVAVGGLNIHVGFDHGLRKQKTSIAVRLHAASCPPQPDTFFFLKFLNSI